MMMISRAFNWRNVPHLQLYVNGSLNIIFVLVAHHYQASPTLWFCQNYYFFFLFLFFCRQGFRPITFEHQGGSFQNFGHSWVMVKGRGVSFSDPARPPGGRGMPSNTPTLFLHLVNINRRPLGGASGPEVSCWVIVDLELFNVFTTTFLHTYSSKNWVNVDDWWLRRV